MDKGNKENQGTILLYDACAFDINGYFTYFAVLLHSRSQEDGSIRQTYYTEEKATSSVYFSFAAESITEHQ